jgi:hypothetical protein
MHQIGCGAASKDHERSELVSVSCAARMTCHALPHVSPARSRLAAVECTALKSPRRSIGFSTAALSCRLDAFFPFRVVRGVTIDETHLRFNVLAASSAMRLRQCERHDVRRSDIRLRAPFRSLACRIEASNRRPDEIRRDASARRQNESRRLSCVFASLQHTLDCIPLDQGNQP